MDHEARRQKDVAIHMAQIKERKAKAKQFRKDLKKMLHRDVEYLRAWVRMPIDSMELIENPRRSTNSKNILFWSVLE